MLVTENSMFIFIIESRSEQVVIAPRSSISSQITHIKLSLRVQMQLYFRPYLKAEQFLDYVIFSVIEVRKLSISSPNAA